MNWVDWIWVVAILVGIVGGLRGGMLSELLRLVTWGLIIFVTLKFTTAMQLPTVIGVVVGLLVVAWVIRKLVCKIAGPPGFLSRLAGLFLGMARMVALMILLTVGVARLHSAAWSRLVCEESQCGATVMLWIYGLPATNQIQRAI
ncbi:MAG: hypothetical protein WCH84_05735 [Verrucomicrobiota bacterium]